MREHLEDRNKSVRAEYEALRSKNVSALEALQRVAKAFYLALSTVRQIVYDDQYGERYGPKRETARNWLKK